MEPLILILSVAVGLYALYAVIRAAVVSALRQVAADSKKPIEKSNIPSD